MRAIQEIKKRVPAASTCWNSERRQPPYAGICNLSRLYGPRRRPVDVVRNRMPNELEAFYKVLGCSCIDITVRKIGTKTVEIICGDEGLLVESPKISAIDNLGRAQLAGSILVVGRGDSEGNLTSLSNEDANYILGKVQLLATQKIKTPYPILTQCEYV